MLSILRRVLEGDIDSDHMFTRRNKAGNRESGSRQWLLHQSVRTLFSKSCLGNHHQNEGYRECDLLPVSNIGKGKGEGDPSDSDQGTSSDIKI